MDERELIEEDDSDDFDVDPNQRVIARLRVYAQAQGDQEAVDWLDDAARFCEQVRLGNQVIL